MVGVLIERYLIELSGVPTHYTRLAHMTSFPYSSSTIHHAISFFR